MEDFYVPSQRKRTRTLALGGVGINVLQSRDIAYNTLSSEQEAYRFDGLEHKTPVQTSDAAPIPSAVPFKMAIRNASYNLNGRKRDLYFFPKTGALPIVRGAVGDTIDNPGDPPDDGVQDEETFDEDGHRRPPAEEEKDDDSTYEGMDQLFDENNHNGGNDDNRSRRASAHFSDTSLDYFAEQDEVLREFRSRRRDSIDPKERSKLDKQISQRAKVLDDGLTIDKRIELARKELEQEELADIRVDAEEAAKKYAVEGLKLGAEVGSATGLQNAAIGGAAGGVVGGAAGYVGGAIISGLDNAGERIRFEWNVGLGAWFKNGGIKTKEDLERAIHESVGERHTEAIHHSHDANGNPVYDDDDDTELPVKAPSKTTKPRPPADDSHNEAWRNRVGTNIANSMTGKKTGASTTVLPPLEQTRRPSNTNQSSGRRPQAPQTGRSETITVPPLQQAQRVSNTAQRATTIPAVPATPEVELPVMKDLPPLPGSRGSGGGPSRLVLGSGEDLAVTPRTGSLADVIGGGNRPRARTGSLGSTGRPTTYNDQDNSAVGDNAGFGRDLYSAIQGMPRTPQPKPITTRPVPQGPFPTLPPSSAAAKPPASSSTDPKLGSTIQRTIRKRPAKPKAKAKAKPVPKAKTMPKTAALHAGSVPDTNMGEAPPPVPPPQKLAASSRTAGRKRQGATSGGVAKTRKTQQQQAADAVPFQEANVPIVQNVGLASVNSQHAAQTMPHTKAAKTKPPKPKTKPRPRPKAKPRKLINKALQPKR